MLRVIIDPNLIASVLIGGITRKRFAELTQKLDLIEFVYCDQLINEVLALARKPYFQSKGIDLATVKTFVGYFRGLALKVMVTSKVKLGRDRNDYYLLSLARDAKADYLITGDPDLLLLEKYLNTQIVSMKTFMDTVNEPFPKE